MPGDHNTAFEKFIANLREEGINVPFDTLRLMRVAFINGALWANEDATRRLGFVKEIAA